MKIVELFPEIARRVREDHLGGGLITHHNFQHAYRVGQAAYTIALKQWGDEVVARKAGVAGLGHNADRLIRHQFGVVTTDAIRNLLSRWIGDEFADEGIAEVQHAVLNHGDINRAGDDRVLIALKDGDRYVNLALDIVMRSALHFSTLPPLDSVYFLDAPGATYNDPKSVLQDVMASLDWVDPTSRVCIRTTAALRMAGPRAAALRFYRDTLLAQLKEEDAFPLS